jgi:GWxTD domain-containing protein
MSNLINLIVFAFILCFSSTLFANIDADMDVITYYQDEKPFIEVNLHIVGSSLTKKKLEQALIETRANVLITIRKEEDIIDFKKYGLISPPSSVSTDFIDLKRFALTPGNYVIQVELSDQLNTSNSIILEKSIAVNAWSDNIFASKTDLLYDVIKSEDKSKTFYKYGYILLPTAYNFFHNKLDKLIVFKEFYSLDKFDENSTATRITIKNMDSQEVEPLIKYKKLKGEAKEVIIEKIDISRMISGNYELITEIINKSNEILLTDTVYFQRSNPKVDAELFTSNEFNIDDSFIGELTDEEVKYNLKALTPTLPQSETNILNILFEENNVDAQKFYLFNYWNTYNPVKPEESFKQYWDIAKAVDVMFYSTIGRGFETDRGYIFLRYGRPNNIITVENEPSAPPYEIWFYDQLDLTGETNMKFLFYNPSLGGGNFELLHSTSRYERQNLQWEVVLYGDASSDIEGNSIDATTVVDNVNRRARDYFEDNN